MLEDYLELHSNKPKPFEGVTALLIQHQLGSQVRMTEALIRLGVRPEQIYWVDIPYTSNAKVQRALHELGIPPKNFSKSTYHLGKSYAPYQRRRIQEMLMKLERKLKAHDHLLVLDDGSYFLEALSCQHLPKFKISIVEQTTRGIIKLNKDSTLRYYSREMPVINVAQSEPKKKYESPFIGEAVCRSLMKLLIGKMKLGRKDKCLVLGFGDIGYHVAKSLVRTFGIKCKNIFIGEPNRAKCRKAVSLGHSIWDRDPEEEVRFRLVVGCSGTTSFGIQDRIFLEDGACMASASSGAAELSREEFIDLADSFPHDQIFVKDRKSLEKKPIHEDIEIRLVDRDVRFLNGGFPVNFTGQVNCVDPKLIQVTHTLQVGAAVQAMKASKRGLIELDQALCDFVKKYFEKITRRD